MSRGIKALQVSLYYSAIEIDYFSGDVWLLSVRLLQMKLILCCRNLNFLTTFSPYSSIQNNKHDTNIVQTSMIILHYKHLNN